jgi:Protein of unknown function (DUF3306)
MSETFFSRWSRRKRESASPREVPDSEAPRPSDETTERAAATSPRLREEVGSRSDPGDGSRSAAAVESPPHPEPLPASDEREPLPPIESIDAGTDVSGFLRPGVPADLAQAALRRAWVTDPAIRDFVGLAENAWDFNAPGGVPGFEPLRAIDDVQRLAAQVAGIASAVTPPDETGEKSGESEQAPQRTSEAVPPAAEDAAAQKEASAEGPEPPRPRHGGALAE